MKRLAVGILLALPLMSPNVGGAKAQNLCREACLQWCVENRSTDSCRNDCAGRRSCAKTGVLCKEQCISWCNNNKPGNKICLADCSPRKSC